MQTIKRLDKEKKLGLVLLVIWILGASLFFGIQLNQKQSKAVGGGFFNNGSSLFGTNATSRAPTFTTQTYQGYYLVLGLSTFAPSINISSISDSQSDTWHLAIQSKHYEDTEIWYTNYTGTNTATVTVTISTSASSQLWISKYILSGVTAGSITTYSNFGTATTISIASVTPPTYDSCISNSGVYTGSITAATFTLAQYFYLPNSAQDSGATKFDAHSEVNNVWQPAYGATTISIPYSPTSSPQWDDTVACFPEGPATSTTTSTTTTTTPTTTTMTFSNTTSTTTTTTKTTSIPTTITVGSNVTSTATTTTTTTAPPGLIAIAQPVKSTTIVQECTTNDPLGYICGNTTFVSPYTTTLSGGLQTIVNQQTLTEPIQATIVNGSLINQTVSTQTQTFTELIVGIPTTSINDQGIYQVYVFSSTTYILKAQPGFNVGGLNPILVIVAVIVIAIVLGGAASASKKPKQRRDKLRERKPADPWKD